MDEFLINDRIKILREHLGLSRDNFCQETGLKSNQLASIENKRQKMPAWYIEKINEIYPEYMYWLATGKEIPEAGQISPMTEETRKSLKLKAG